jgi:hypothetical protein
MGSHLSFFKDLVIRHIDRIGRDRLKTFGKRFLLSLFLFESTTYLYWWYRCNKNLKKGQAARRDRDAKYKPDDIRFDTNLP